MRELVVAEYHGDFSTHSCGSRSFKNKVSRIASFSRKRSVRKFCSPSFGGLALEISVSACIFQNQKLYRQSLWSIATSQRKCGNGSPW